MKTKSVSKESWKHKIRYGILKPIYVELAKISPNLAIWIRVNIFRSYNYLKSLREKEFLPLERDRDSTYLFVDTTCISACDAKTGIQRVVNNVFTQLLAQEKNTIASKIFNFKKIISSYAYMQNHNEQREKEIFFSAGDKLLLLDSSWDQAKPMKKIINNLHSNGGTVGGVIYDLFPITYPKNFPSQAFIYNFVSWHKMLLKKADDVICISRTVADTVEKYYNEQGFRRKRPLRLHYFPMGASFGEAAGEPREALKKFVCGGPTFLMVGTIEPRKGHNVALDAFAKLLDTTLEAKLLIIGKNGWKNDDIINKLKNEVFRGKVLWLKDAEDAELQWAYRNASVLIAASEDEGYGLPLIEAAHFGIPIIASDIPIFREVAGEHADYFKVMDANALCEAMQRWIASEKHPDSNEIKLYTWKESAQAILDIMNHKQEPYKILC